MNHNLLTQHLSTLITKWENEVIEFKLAGTYYKTDKIGEYFSALANGLFSGRFDDGKIHSYSLQFRLRSLDQQLR